MICLPDWRRKVVFKVGWNLKYIDWKREYIICKRKRRIHHFHGRNTRRIKRGWPLHVHLTRIKRGWTLHVHLTRGLNQIPWVGNDSLCYHLQFNKRIIFDFGSKYFHDVNWRNILSYLWLDEIKFPILLNQWI
jgi:hypothetical protein